MTESESNVVQAQLRAIITMLGEHSGEFRALGARMTSLEERITALSSKLKRRTDRIEVGDG